MSSRRSAAHRQTIRRRRAVALADVGADPADEHETAAPPETSALPVPTNEEASEPEKPSEGAEVVVRLDRFRKK